MARADKAAPRSDPTAAPKDVPKRKLSLFEKEMSRFGDQT
jgi:hypothetical protein